MLPLDVSQVSRRLRRRGINTAEIIAKKCGNFGEALGCRSCEAPVRYSSLSRYCCPLCNNLPTPDSQLNEKVPAGGTPSSPDVLLANSASCLTPKGPCTQIVFHWKGEGRAVEDLFRQSTCTFKGKPAAMAPAGLSFSAGGRWKHVL